MEREKALLLLVAIVAGIAAVMLWTTGLSARGADCGSAISPASFEPGDEFAEADCDDTIANRRINAGLVTAIAVGALWLHLRADSPADDREDGERLV